MQFHEAAMGTGKSKGPSKEIATLRKFLHKNQTQRFTDKAASRLFDTIQIYCVDKSKSSTDSQKESGVSISSEDREGLLEDALKMPFTVFTTKQKKTMLKWMEDVRGEIGFSPETNVSRPSLTKLNIIDLDLDEKYLSLMQENTGETYENVALPSGHLGDKIQNAFENTNEAVDVEATINNDGVVTIMHLCELS